MIKKMLLFLTVVMVLALAAITASASPPEDAGGVWSYLPNLDEFVFYKVADGNQFFTFGEQGDWTGTFDGASYDYGSGVVHSNGSWLFKGKAIFASVTVDGRTGSLEMKLNGSRPDGVSNWVGKWVLTGGTLHEAGLRGQGTFDGPGWQGDPTVWGKIPYAGSVHFESD
ncbi:MAG TPA: hypothetical protein VLE70_05205 [Anaerolineae bacterium]|nr:hypothetical protein [Anaerolineae bacterium]